MIYHVTRDKDIPAPNWRVDVPGVTNIGLKLAKREAIQIARLLAGWRGRVYVEK